MAIKKSDLYSSIWASCDELRGGMDASQYKDYVLFMLFIKYVSDKYADYDGFEPPINIPKGASFKDMVALKGDPDIGNKINTDIIQKLIEANSSSNKFARTDFPDFNDPNKLGDGHARVERIGNLIAIFENPALDFSQNRAEHDDILGDAYEYLMRHFASESGKSKGQFYTPAEVSRVIAKVLGISPENTVAATTAYDPTCGSGSLLLKVAAEAGKHITLEGQEKDSTTAGLARMNMILHDFPTANIASGGEGTLVKPRFLDGEQLRTYDYVVANPPFSDKTWSTGMTLGESGEGDRHKRFAWGVPPKKQGDYAYLLHIVRSMKSTGKAACILPHGVLFRGNAEAAIRRNLVRSGILKGIIGLPANLFYGTGIPACILVLDKDNAAARKGIFMIDASKGFRKDGPKNRLRDQDIHKIVDTFRKQDESDPRYARMVALAEIADAKNDYNLNLPRYIDSSSPEDLQDIDGHLRGGIPERDLDALGDYWQRMPALRAALFASLRPGYARLRLPLAEVKPAILGHAEFTAFQAQVSGLFDRWRAAHRPAMVGFGQDAHPKELIETLSESLLAAFEAAPLVHAYDIYQHLMDYCAETLHDDAYLIAAVGWQSGAKPREIRQVKNKEGKLVWPEKEDYRRGRRRFKSDLVPAALVIDRWFAAERDAITAREAELSAVEQQMDEMREEQGGEDGLLAEVMEGEGEKQKITAKAVKARLKEIGKDADDAEERAALTEYAALLDRQADTKAQIKATQETLEEKLDAKYAKLTEAEVQMLVVDDKWLATLAAAVQGELDRVSQTLTGRIRQLAERYATPLPHITAELEVLDGEVMQHLMRMGFSHDR
ncbi:N-6 DNA methylase [Aromatoleum toluvorans]|uniref:site-specific DNA-methyltransferase (adenine-specific) n=1 Tax=Aromatoleum toluvorans TaxID=92002 RepID=A0ABX1Q0D6_9RHOO|nr:N-6 DNA methylase [Aromatoleum toluvorans]NMG45149.1 N-6 DNA methylase [Aromatoleum toluvorans]